MLCGLILLLDTEAKAQHPPRFMVYGLKLFSPESLQVARDCLIGECISDHGKECQGGYASLPGDSCLLDEAFPVWVPRLPHVQQLVPFTGFNVYNQEVAVQ